MQLFRDRGQLYDLDRRPISVVHAVVSGELYVIRFPKEPAAPPPAEAFLLMDGQDAPVKLSLTASPRGGITPALNEWIGWRPVPPQQESRSDVRVPINEDMLMHTPARKEPVPVRVNNLSAGGLRFVSHDRYSTGVTLDFSLPLDQPPEPPVTLSAEVRNVVPLRTEEGISDGYGCRFSDAGVELTDRIRRYVFQRQLQERRKKYD